MVRDATLKSTSISRRPRAYGTRIWVHVAPGAVVIHLSVVRIGLLVRLHIRAAGRELSRNQGDDGVR
jgi:hypothetical protein